MQCERCGSKLDSYVEDGVLHVQCSDCGNSWAAPYDPPPRSPGNQPKPERVVVRIKWPKSEPIPSGHLMLLRKRLPLLVDQPIPELKAQLTGEGRVLQEMWREEAEDLRRDLEAFELLVITEPR
jgi:hypothetical protein